MQCMCSACAQHTLNIHLTELCHVPQVHPDLFQDPDARATNERSFKLLQEYLAAGLLHPAQWLCCLHPRSKAALPATAAKSYCFACTLLFCCPARCRRQRWECRPVRIDSYCTAQHAACCLPACPSSRCSYPTASMPTALCCTAGHGWQHQCCCPAADQGDQGRAALPYSFEFWIKSTTEPTGSSQQQPTDRHTSDSQTSSSGSSADRQAAHGSGAAVHLQAAAPSSHTENGQQQQAAPAGPRAAGLHKVALTLPPPARRDPAAPDDLPRGTQMGLSKLMKAVGLQR